MTDSVSKQVKNSSFTFNDRYTSGVSQGITPDSCAAGVSTVGASQLAALQKLHPTIQIDTSTAGQHRIRFGKGEAESRGTVTVPTPLGSITFHVVPINTPFFYCIQDMDRMGSNLIISKTC